LILGLGEVIVFLNQIYKYIRVGYALNLAHLVVQPDHKSLYHRERTEVKTDFNKGCWGRRNEVEKQTGNLGLVLCSVGAVESWRAYSSSLSFLVSWICARYRVLVLVRTCYTLDVYTRAKASQPVRCRFSVMRTFDRGGVLVILRFPLSRYT
jgi:hypothetical protein